MRRFRGVTVPAASFDFHPIVDGVAAPILTNTGRLLTNTRAGRARNGPVSDTSPGSIRVRHVSRVLGIGSNTRDGVGVDVRRRGRTGVTIRDQTCYPNTWDRRCTERLPVGVLDGSRVRSHEPTPQISRRVILPAPAPVEPGRCPGRPAYPPAPVSPAPRVRRPRGT